MTEWAQVNGRSAIFREEKFALDVWYGDNLSPTLDPEILWRTVDSGTPQPAAAIIVLGGEDPGHARTRQALDLYAAGYAPQVVFSGGTLLSAGLACSSAQMSADAARQLGLPAGAALVAPEAQST